MKKVRVLINPNSGMGFSLDAAREVFAQHWEQDGVDLTYQYSRSRQDGEIKVTRALDEGIDVLLVAGGDGMVNSVGQLLVDTPVTLGVIPSGSGNGFARHFGTPMALHKAIAALARGRAQAIDVGLANGKPFFVTCSLAWDAAIVRSFDKSPVRGILPYVFSGVYELFEYHPQPFLVTVDDAPPFLLDKPMVFTIANLTQFGGGAQIAPTAAANDGFLELVTVERRDAGAVAAEFTRLFAGTLDRAEAVNTLKFKRLHVRRTEPGPVQMDGEQMDTETEMTIEVRPHALNVLVPEH